MSKKRYIRERWEGEGYFSISDEDWINVCKGSVLLVSSLHQNRKHTLLEGMPHVGDGVDPGKPIIGIYFGDAR